jgi:hypothetical protein
MGSDSERYAMSAADRFLVAGHILKRQDIGQPKVMPVSAQAIAHVCANGTGRAGDQYVVGLWVNHGRPPERRL